MARPDIAMDCRTSPMPSYRQLPSVLRHLHALTDWFVHGDQRIPFIHIYARPQTSGSAQALEFITARESGFEGIACIDDVARAAVLALRVYEHTHSVAALQLARSWLDFVEYMQEPDGRFTNFIINARGAKNRRGLTSHTGGKWWTARAMWALASAWRVTGDDRYLRLFLRGRLAPTSDMKVKGLHALVLMELYEARPDDALRRRICALCDAIVASGPGYFRDHIGRGDVAMWGYHQLQAVARAGRLFSRLDYIAACEQTVHNLVEPVVANGFYHEYPLQQDDQCAYDVSTLVLGLEDLYRVMLKPRYRGLALQCAAWLDGHNPAGVPLYDRRTGRCSDGIARGVASQNCGAESAIEAAFVELARRRLRPGARGHGAVAPVTAVAALV